MKDEVPELRERTKAFALRVIRLFSAPPAQDGRGADHLLAGTWQSQKLTGGAPCGDTTHLSKLIWSLQIRHINA